MKQSESARDKFYKWRDKFSDSKTNRQSFMFQMDWSDPDDVALIEIIAILKSEERFSQVIRQALEIEMKSIDGKDNPDNNPGNTIGSGSAGQGEPESVSVVQAEQAPLVDKSEQLEAEKQQIESKWQWLQAESERLESERLWHEKQLENQRRALESEQTKHTSAIQEQLQRLEQLLLDSGYRTMDKADSTIPAGLHQVAGSESYSQTVAMRPISGAPMQMAVPQFSVPDYEDDDMLLEVHTDRDAGKRAADNFLHSIMTLQA